MKILFASLVLIGSAFACGTERWSVKSSITSQEPVDRSLLALTQLAAPFRAVLTKLKSSRLPSEIPVRVQATVTGFKLEADGDIHIVLSDGTSTMIGEIPDPACVKDSALRIQIAAVRKKFVSIYGAPTPRMKHVSDKTPIIFTGQLLFDFLHGQTGVAKNGAEVHPIVQIE